MKKKVRCRIKTNKCNTWDLQRHNDALAILGRCKVHSLLANEAIEPGAVQTPKVEWLNREVLVDPLLTTEEAAVLTNNLPGEFRGHYYLEGDAPYLTRYCRSNSPNKAKNRHT